MAGTLGVISLSAAQIVDSPDYLWGPKVIPGRAIYRCWDEMGLNAPTSLAQGLPLESCLPDYRTYCTFRRSIYYYLLTLIHYLNNEEKIKQSSNTNKIYWRTFVFFYFIYFFLSFKDIFESRRKQFRHTWRMVRERIEVDAPVAASSVF